MTVQCAEHCPVLQLTSVDEEVCEQISIRSYNNKGGDYQGGRIFEGGRLFNRLFKGGDYSRGGATIQVKH